MVQFIKNKARMKQEKESNDFRNWDPTEESASIKDGMERELKEKQMR